MTGKIKLAKITIEINGNQTELSIDHAKELYNELDSLFGEKVISLSPVTINNDKWPTIQRFEVTC